MYIHIYIYILVLSKRRGGTTRLYIYIHILDTSLAEPDPPFATLWGGLAMDIRAGHGLETRAREMLLPFYGCLCTFLAYLYLLAQV